jgi:hypothetical protein
VVLGEFNLCKGVYDNITWKYRNAKYFMKVGFHIYSQCTMVLRSAMKEVLAGNIVIFLLTKCTAHSFGNKKPNMVW